MSLKLFAVEVGQLTETPELTANFSASAIKQHGLLLALDRVTGKLKKAASNGTDWVGLIANKYDTITADSTAIVAITNKDVLIETSDTSARKYGEFLDINATSDGVTTATNNDVVCVAGLAAGANTIVKINKARLFV